MNVLPSVNEMIELAKTDPEKLEQLRLQEVEALIDSAPAHLQRRLRGLQFQIDCRRQLHRSNLGACIAISSMMMESVQKLNQALHCGETAPVVTPSPKVIPFTAPDKRAPLQI